MNSWQVLLGGGMIFGIIAGGWRYIKLVLAWLASFFIARYDIGDYLNQIVVGYCQQNMRVSIFRIRNFDSHILPINSLKHCEHTLIESFESPILCWKGIFPILLNAPGGGGSGSDGSAAGPSPTPNSKTILIIRGTVNIQKIVEKALNRWTDFQRNNDIKQRFQVIRKAGLGPLLGRKMQGENADRTAFEGTRSNEDNMTRYALGFMEPLQHHWSNLKNWTNIGAKPFDVLAYPDYVIDRIEEIRQWLDMRDWYSKRSVPWRMGLACLKIHLDYQQHLW